MRRLSADWPSSMPDRSMTSTTASGKRNIPPQGWLALRLTATSRLKARGMASRKRQCAARSIAAGRSDSLADGVTVLEDEAAIIRDHARRLLAGETRGLAYPRAEW